MSKTQEQLFEEWNDEKRATEAMQAVSQWYQDGQPDMSAWAKENPDGFLLLDAQLSSARIEGDGRKGEQYALVTYSRHDLRDRLNELLATRKWHIVPGSIGCGHTRKSPDASSSIERIEPHFWAVLERV